MTQRRRQRVRPLTAYKHVDARVVNAAAHARPSTWWAHRSSKSGAPDAPTAPSNQQGELMSINEPDPEALKGPTYGGHDLLPRRRPTADVRGRGSGRRTASGLDARSVTTPATSRRNHSEGSSRPGTGCNLHTWLVTGPYQAPASLSADRVPWGTYHLRKNGALVAACGTSAVAWHVFWGHAVDPHGSQACRDCLKIVGRLGSDRS